MEENTEMIEYVEQLADSMEKSLNNVIDVKNQQEYLVKTLECLNDKKFEQLIEGMKKDLKDMKKQIKNLRTRSKCMKQVCEYAKAKDTAVIVATVLDAIVQK